VDHRRASSSGYSRICRCPACTMGARLLAGCHQTVPSLAAIPIHKIKSTRAVLEQHEGQPEEGRAALAGEGGGTARGRYHAASHQPLALMVTPTTLRHGQCVATPFRQRARR
jgi:hypothetical protein